MSFGSKPRRKGSWKARIVDIDVEIATFCGNEGSKIISKHSQGHCGSHILLKRNRAFSLAPFCAFPRRYRSKWRPELPITIGCARWPRTIANIPLLHGEMTIMIFCWVHRVADLKKLLLKQLALHLNDFANQGCMGVLKPVPSNGITYAENYPLVSQDSDDMTATCSRILLQEGQTKTFFQRQKSRAAIIDVRFLYIFPLVGWLQEDKRSFPPCNNLLGYSMLQLTSKTR